MLFAAGKPNPATSAIRSMTVPNERWWTVQHGRGPVVATAIHHGHDLRREVAEAIALGLRDYGDSAQI